MVRDPPGLLIHYFIQKGHLALMLMMSRLPPHAECTCLSGSGPLQLRLRCPPPPEVTRDAVLNLDLAEWGHLQMEDASLVRMRRRVMHSDGDDGQGCLAPVVLRDGLLMCRDEGARRHAIFVPTALRGRVVWAVHERLMH
ncbi:unnamed protein product [Lampetra fluviatilis]